MTVFTSRPVSISSSVLLLWLLFACGPAFATDATLARGQELYRHGQYRLAAQAFIAIQQTGNVSERARATALLGITYFQLHRRDEALDLLTKALATSAGSADERARWLGTRAEIKAAQGDSLEAERDYEQALSLLHPSADLATVLQLARISILPKARQAEALRALPPAVMKIKAQDERLRAYLMLGSQARTLGAVDLAYQHLNKAQLLAADARTRAEALGQLAQLYEDQQRFAEALRLNAQALIAARGVNAEDELFELDWRAGRLYRHLAQPEPALAAYERAVEHLEAIRQDIPVEYRDGRSSFRETLEPVYLGLADLLLAKATQQPQIQRLALLRRARGTVELIKQAEIDDFLGGRCTVNSTKAPLLDTISPKTAVVYPIILPDRLEVLVSVGTELYQSVQAVPAKDLQETAQELAHALRTGSEAAKVLGQQMHSWLLKPVVPWLAERQVQTLVIVPDGVLRLIPFAALFDGARYAIENYAIATSPGLTLFEPSPIAREERKALLAGLSEPGPVIEHLPPSILQGLVEASPAATTASASPDSRALAVRGSAGNSSARGLTLDPQSRDRVKERLSLPGVAKEIADLQQQVPHTLLFNDQFTASAFRQRVAAEPYSIVHIASHGVFGPSAASSFILAYDDLLTLDEFERLLRADVLRDRPIDLLTLSACQTAEGDDRAPLGISGVALKARVKGAMGTLWPVADEAAAHLMTTFYRELKQPGQSKVGALRAAQLALLQDNKLAHPFFWSPFIIVGNWL